MHTFQFPGGSAGCPTIGIWIMNEWTLSVTRDFSSFHLRTNPILCYEVALSRELLLLVCCVNGISRGSYGQTCGQQPCMIQERGGRDAAAGGA